MDKLSLAVLTAFALTWVLLARFQAHAAGRRSTPSVGPSQTIELQKLQQIRANAMGDLEYLMSGQARPQGSGNVGCVRKPVQGSAVS